MSNLEREYIKEHQEQQVLHIVQLPNDDGDMHTWCIMICLVIPILSLLLFIQSLYSLSKLQFLLVYILGQGLSNGGNVVIKKI